jgi:hypothetical protein
MERLAQHSRLHEQEVLTKYEPKSYCTRLRYSIKACRPMCILERDSILEQNGHGSLALLSRWLLLKVLEVKFLKIPKVIGA